MKRRKWLLLPFFLIFRRRARAATPQPNTKVSVYNETPAQNTATGVLTLAAAPNPPNSLRLHLNGIRQKPVEDYSVLGGVVTPVAANVALYSSAAVIVADYDK